MTKELGVVVKTSLVTQVIGWVISLELGEEED